MIQLGNILHYPTSRWIQKFTVVACDTVHTVSADLLQALLERLVFCMPNMVGCLLGTSAIQKMSCIFFKE